MNWLSPLCKELNPDVRSAKTHIAVAQAAERAGLDYMFCADAWGSRGAASTEFELCDPMLMGPILAGVLFGATEHIKVITTIHQLWLHPLQIARIGGNLDALSGGRWGMNAVSGVGFAPELVKSVSTIDNHDDYYASASESMEIVFQAWANDGNVDFSGKYYQARGRLVGPMPVQQPRPVIVSAVASERGRDETEIGIAAGELTTLR